jgi:hypothetical protein
MRLLWAEHMTRREEAKDVYSSDGETFWKAINWKNKRAIGLMDEGMGASKIPLQGGSQNIFLQTYV